MRCATSPPTTPAASSPSRSDRCRRTAPERPIPARNRQRTRPATWAAGDQRGPIRSNMWSVWGRYTADTGAPRSWSRCWSWRTAVTGAISSWVPCTSRVGGQSGRARFSADTCAYRSGTWLGVPPTSQSQRPPYIANCSLSRTASSPNMRTSPFEGGAVQSGRGSSAWQVLRWLVWSYIASRLTCPYSEATAQTRRSAPRSSAGLRPGSPCPYAASSARWPPADPPARTMRSGSHPSSTACPRTQCTARRASEAIPGTSVSGNRRYATSTTTCP